MNSSPLADDARLDLTLGVEISDSATRFTLTAGSAPGSRHWHARLAAPATPRVAADTLASLVTRAVGEEWPALAESGANVALAVALEDVEVGARRGMVYQLRRAPGWDNSPFAVVLAERLRADGHIARIELASATDAAAVAEARLGAGQGIGEGEPMLYLRLARSVTSSVVLDSRYLAGVNGAQGRLGHLVVREGGPRCSCGAYGHLEPLASAQSLVRNLIGRASASDASTAAMLRVSGGRAEAMTAAQVAQLASEGDEAASSVLDEALDALAPMLAILSAVLAPARLVVGGPLALAGEAFLAPLRERMETARPPGGVLPELRAGTLEPGAALAGAWLLAAGDGILH